ncbi:MAG: hypothetical protein ACJA2Q_001584 [Pseudohongiellaceae bacterium]|jgi:hypothetical protein
MFQSAYSITYPISNPDIAKMPFLKSSLTLPQNGILKKKIPDKI